MKLHSAQIPKISSLHMARSTLLSQNPINEAENSSFGKSRVEISRQKKTETSTYFETQSLCFFIVLPPSS